jgi:hypothetical protein
MDCLICKEVMDGFLVEKGYAIHPTCGDLNSAAGDPESVDLKKLVQRIIRSTDANSPRSLQKLLGPSEVGEECERKIAYQILDVPTKNRLRDPWPAIQGTAVHHWMEKAVKAWPVNNPALSPKFGGMHWETEMRVAANEIVSGSSDVYDHVNFRVIDWKTASTEYMKKYIAQGPPRKYIIQINLYGLGHENAGRQVKDLALVFLARGGRLSDTYVWRDVYRREIAEEALARLEGIGDMLLDGTAPQDFPAHPSDDCGFCPWFSSDDATMGVTADGFGCPGR